MSIATELTNYSTYLSNAYNALEKQGLELPENKNLQNVEGLIKEFSKKNVKRKAVNFWDYDGTLLYSYTKTELASLTELPSYPQHKGLTCQGWNWTLQQLKDYMQTKNIVHTGLNYVTDDNKTRLYLNTGMLYYSFPIGIQTNSVEGGTITIDWGDGSNNEVINADGELHSLNHSFGANINSYTMTLYGTSGTTYSVDYSSSVDFMRTVVKVELAGNYKINNFAFRGMYNVQTISIPRTTDFTSSTYVFYYCRSLKAAVLPPSFSNLGTGIFSFCNGINTICLQPGVGSFASYLFRGCYSLNNLSVDKATESSIPTYTFNNNDCLQDFDFPNKITTISTYAFEGSTGLKRLVFPATLTTIAGRAFGGCTNMQLYDFRALTAVPELQNTTAFNDLPATCQIVVPNSLYSSWIAANNWSSFASQIIKASDYTE